MPLSAEQMEKANRFFRLNGVIPDCPYCSMHGWEGGERWSPSRLWMREATRSLGTRPC